MGYFLFHYLVTSGQKMRVWIHEALSKLVASYLRVNKCPNVLRQFCLEPPRAQFLVDTETLIMAK